MTHGLKLLPFESFPTSILQNRGLSFKPFLFFTGHYCFPDLWDLLIAADWVEKNKAESLKYISTHLSKNLKPDELIKLSRILLIDLNNPGLKAIHKSIHIEHGNAEIKDSNFFGLQIKHAHLITSKRE